MTIAVTTNHGLQKPLPGTSEPIDITVLNDNMDVLSRALVAGSTMAQGAITADAPVSHTVTWNNGAVTFTGWKINVTDTASAAASKLLDLQVGGVSVFSVRKDGQITSGAWSRLLATQGAITADAPTLSTTATWNDAGVTFTGWLQNITNTNSAAASKLIDLQVGGVSMFSVRKDGGITGTLLTAAQPNITSIGTLTALAVAAASASVSAANGVTNTQFLAENTSNTAIAAHAYFEAKVGGTTSTGDPHVRFTIPSGTSWYAGVDNSASDAFIIGQGTAVGTTGYFQIGSAGNTGIGGAAPDTAVTLNLYSATPATAGVAQYGIQSAPTLSSAATTSGTAGYFRVITQAAAFTMTSAYGLYVENPSKGAGSAITTNYGIYVVGQQAGGTNNVGLWVAGASGGSGYNHGIVTAGSIAINSTSTNNQIWTASAGAGSTTMYIGNASINVTSDVRLKNVLGPTEGSALDLFRRLDLFDYTWNDPSDTAEVNRNSRGTWRYGVSAQQLIGVMPWLVNAEGRDCPTCLAGKACETHTSFMNVDFEYAFGATAAAFREVEDRIARLEAALAAR